MSKRKYKKRKKKIGTEIPKVLREEVEKIEPRKIKIRKVIKTIPKKVGKERIFSFPTIKKVVKALSLKDAINKTK